MLSRSISRTDAAPRPRASALARMRAASRVRCAARSRLESSTPGMARAPGGMMTAHATTGRAPRAAPRIAGHRGLPFGAGAPIAGLTLADACRLPAQPAQVVELGAAHLAAPHHGEVGDHRAVHRKDPLDAHAVRHLADGERLRHPAPAPGDAHPLERLDALLV